MSGMPDPDAAAQEIDIGGRTLRLTSLDRILYPSGFTKRDLIDYYAGVAGVLLPHIAGRPLTLGRWPAGVLEPGFAQTECRGAPDWVTTRAVRLRTGAVRNYCVIDEPASLVWAANLGTLELHTYVGGGPDAEDAAAVVFDLDPRTGAGLLDVAETALALRDLLELDACVKTSGSDGLHVLVPLNTPHSWDAARVFGASVAAGLDTIAVNVDHAVNNPRRLLVAPYSLRAANRPTVSAPVSWAEIEQALRDRRTDSITFTAVDMPARIASVGDLFAPMLEVEQRLSTR
jgi:bifunctional non-homologous end joining protein LigD